MEFVKKNLAKWIEAAILLTLGILLIVVGAGNNGSASDAVSVIIGIVAIVVGSLSLALVAFVGIKNNASFATVGLSAAALIGLGISLLVWKYALDLVGLLLTIIPYILVMIGLVLLADGIIMLVRNLKSKEVLVPAVVNIVTGAVATTIAFLCMSFDGKSVIGTDVQLIIIGVLVIIAACLICLLTFIGKKEK